MHYKPSQATYKMNAYVLTSTLSESLISKIKIYMLSYGTRTSNAISTAIRSAQFDPSVMTLWLRNFLNRADTMMLSVKNKHMNWITSLMMVELNLIILKSGYGFYYGGSSIKRYFEACIITTTNVYLRQICGEPE